MPNNFLLWITNSKTTLTKSFIEYWDIVNPEFVVILFYSIIFEIWSMLEDIRFEWIADLKKIKNTLCNTREAVWSFVVSILVRTSCHRKWLKIQTALISSRWNFRKPIFKCWKPIFVCFWHWSSYQNYFSKVIYAQDIA